MTAPHIALAEALGGEAFMSSVIVNDRAVMFGVTGVVRVGGRVLGHVSDGTAALVAAFQALDGAA
jgi:hypothetical protein